MENIKSFLILGGDLRQNYLISLLRNQGYTCHDAIDCGQYDNDALTDMLSHSRFILGPIPFTTNNTIKGVRWLTLAELSSRLHEGQHIFGGKIPSKLVTELRSKNIICHDYMNDEELAIFNSIATAEGLIADIITSYPGNLYKSNVLILGYGKCGKTLADRLKGLGCNVTICARNENALALAYSLGHTTIFFEELAAETPKYDLIINTVPAPVITADILETLTTNTYLYDIASSPGGIDFAAAAGFGLHASLHLSLPGKYAPKASADALYHFILKKLKQFTN